MPLSSGIKFPQRHVSTITYVDGKQTIHTAFPGIATLAHADIFAEVKGQSP